MKKTIRIYPKSRHYKRRTRALGYKKRVLHKKVRTINYPKSLEKIAEAAGIERKTLAKSYRLLLKELNNLDMPLPNINKYIEILVTRQKLPSIIEKRSLEMLEICKRSKITIGKDPKGFAAAIVYYAYTICNKKKEITCKISQKELAKINSTTEVTIRTRCKEIKKCIEKSDYFQPIILNIN